jgi:hypothetical protein
VNQDPALRRILGLGDSPDGIGQSYATARTSGPGSGLEHVPLRSATSVVRKALGADDSLAVMALRGVLSGGAGAVVGIALAPDHDKRTKYGVIGGLLGLFLGPIGIGAQALYVLTKD